MKITSYKLITTTFFFLIMVSLKASVRLPGIIGNNMIFQQKQAAPVWGWDTPGQLVTVKFGTITRSSIADAAGYWKVILPAMKASAIHSEMYIKGSESITLRNILVGEVWLCSGQSNMEYPMKNGFGGKPLKGVDSLGIEMTADYPQIRLFRVEKVLSTPDVTTSGWNECRGNALVNASAIGYFFARNLHRTLHVPVGVIMSSWGGSRIEAWTSEDMYAALPVFKESLAKKPVMISGFVPGKNYASMIQPLAPFAIKGFLWYQGEANCLIDDGMLYADKMQALVEGWRNAWSGKDLPFYYVQIAPFYYSRRNTKLPHAGETLPEFWEAQYASLNIPKTDIVVTTDLVDLLTDIHPSYKWEIARRLSNIALTHDYKQKGIETTGPVFRKMQVKNGKAVLTFSHADGLKSTDGKELNWFTIACDDGKFEPANVVIDGNTLIVSNLSVSNPKAVRFAWSETAQPNFINDAGLPAVPFRTDGKTWKSR